MVCELILQSAIALAFYHERNIRPEGSWIAVGALDPSFFSRDFAVGHIAWGVTSELPNFSHRSSANLRVIRLIGFVTQLTAVSHAGSIVSCHNFLTLRLCFSSRSRPGYRSLCLKVELH
jgi:hypothetical protein